MGLLLCVAAGALIVGWLTGGSLVRLGSVPLRGWPLVLGAVGAAGAGVLLSTAGGRLARVGGAASLVAAAGLLLMLMARNRRVEGIPLLAAGLLLNAVVIAANGAMPVSSYALDRAGVTGVSVRVGAAPGHSLADGQTRLRAIGDVIPVPLPLRPAVLSAGDILVVAGVGLLILAGMHRRA